MAQKPRSTRATVPRLGKELKRSFFDRSVLEVAPDLIGEEIVRESSKLLILVYRANVADDKVPHLSLMVEKVKLVELLLRLSLDMQKISPKQYWGVTQLTESISKQATAWKKYAAKRPLHGGQGRHD